MPEERTKHFRRVRLEPPSKFDRRSFRVKLQGSHRLIIGCPRGHYDTGTRECRTATVVQAILHPLTEGNPCPRCQRAHMGFRF